MRANQSPARSISPAREPLSSGPALFRSSPFRHFSPPTADSPVPRLCDAEKSVESLCRKFEDLSAQLRRKEALREHVERETMIKKESVEAVQATISRRRLELEEDLSACESSVAAIRASALGAVQQATWQSERVREEQVSAERLEEVCVRLGEECRAESLLCDAAQARISEQERQSVQKECENAETVRNFRHVEADKRSAFEDLGIFQQRLLLARNELQSYTADIEETRIECLAHSEETEHLNLLRPSKKRQLAEHEARIEAVREARGAVRSETNRKEAALAKYKMETQSAQSSLSSLMQDFSNEQREVEMVDCQIRRESEFVSVALSEIAAMEELREKFASDLKTHCTNAEETELGIQIAAKAKTQFQQSGNLIQRQLADLSADEQRLVATSNGLNKARHAEDLAFEDVQTELQMAFRRREELADELITHTRVRDSLAEQLKGLRPEIGQADARCTFLEGQLARRACELENELAQQRRTQQEIGAVASAARNFGRKEARLRAELGSANESRSGWAEEGRWIPVNTSDPAVVASGSMPTEPLAAEPVAVPLFQRGGGAGEAPFSHRVVPCLSPFTPMIRK